MKSIKKIKHEYYDRFYRDKQSAKFYRSKLWKQTQAMKLRRDPLCETCKQAGRTTVAKIVHHLIPVKKGTHNLDLAYLVSLCPSCHNAIESEMDREDRDR